MLKMRKRQITLPIENITVQIIRCINISKRLVIAGLMALLAANPANSLEQCTQSKIYIDSDGTQLSGKAALEHVVKHAELYKGTNGCVRGQLWSNGELVGWYKLRVSGREAAIEITHYDGKKFPNIQLELTYPENTQSRDD